VILVVNIEEFLLFFEPHQGPKLHEEGCELVMIEIMATFNK
jgi:hypothetical protein